MNKSDGTCLVHEDGCTKFQLMAAKMKTIEQTTTTIKRQFWAIILLLLTIAGRVFLGG